MSELELRGRNDLTMGAQLKVLPDQFEIILNKQAVNRRVETAGRVDVLVE